MYSHINIDSVEFHEVVDSIKSIYVLCNDNAELVDLLDSMQFESHRFIKNCESVASMDSESSEDEIRAVRELMLNIFSLFYDVDSWCNLDLEDPTFINSLKQHRTVTIQIDGTLRCIDHATTVCHGWDRHSTLIDTLNNETI